MWYLCLEHLAIPAMACYSCGMRKNGVRHLPERTIYPTGPWDKFEPYIVDGCPKLKAGTINEPS